MTKIPTEFHDLLNNRALYVLGTRNPNGSVQLNPLWGELYEGNIRINTAVGRQKHKNLRDRGDNVTILVMDPDNDQRYIEIRGKLAELTEENGDEVIDRLAKKYLGTETYPFHKEDETRITAVIEPTRVFSQAG